MNRITVFFIRFDLIISQKIKSQKSQFANGLSALFQLLVIPLTIAI